MRLKQEMIAIGVVGTMLVGAPAAFAQSPAQQGYSMPGGVVQSALNNGPSQGTAPANAGSPAARPVAAVSRPAAATQATANSRQLPFTGLDVGLVLAAGGLLLVLGLGIRRLTGPTNIA